MEEENDYTSRQSCRHKQNDKNIDQTKFLVILALCKT